MTDVDRLVVVGFVLLLLGGSYLFAVFAVASEFLPVATISYLVVAVALVLRIVTESENS